MSSDLSSKCRTCLSDSNFFHQLFDYVDENYKILEMLEGIVPQIDIKCNTQFSTVVCQPCVDKLLTGYKFQQLCIETNNRLHDLLGIAVFETEPKVEKSLDPLTDETNFKMKQEVDDDASYEREINADELEVTIRSDHENDWEPLASDSDTDSSNETLSVLKERSAMKSPLKGDHSEKLNKIKIRINNFPCKECGKVLNSYYRLKRHKAMHMQKAKHPCETILKANILTHKIEQNNSADVSSDQNETNEINDTREFVDSKENDNEVSKENMKDPDAKETFTFQCPDCPRSFEKQTSLAAHYKVHKKKHANKLNNKDKKVEPKFEENKTPNQKETAEDKEPNVFIKEELKITHINNNSEDSDSDNTENDLFIKPVKNIDFVDTRIGGVEKSNKSNKSFPCEVCGKIFDRSSSLKRHSSVHCLTKQHECQICKYRFATENLLKAHLSQHENDTIGNLNGQSRPEGFKCPHCPRRFEKQASLSAHRQTHIRDAAEVKYRCMVCKRNLKTVRTLTEHITHKHPEVKKHRCDECGVTFVLHAHLVEHLNRHKGNQNLVCLICEKEFIYQNSLIQHMRIHTGERPYLCPQCGKTFRTSSLLRHHMERHANLKKYQCPECPIRFNCRSDVTKHTLTHTNAKPHACDICGLRYTRIHTLKKHKLRHSGVKAFKCDQCSMAFFIISHLKRHMRTHTGEKPHKCKYCERAFAESGDLNKHLRTHVGENTYMCDQCPMAFKYHAELRQHRLEHYKMAQQQLQQTQKMSDEAQQHDLNDSQQMQLNDQQQQLNMTEQNNQHIIKADQSHNLTLGMANYDQQMSLLDHRQQLLPLGQQQNQQVNTENVISRQDNLDMYKESQ